MDDESEVENGEGPELGLVEIAFGGAFDAARHVKEAVAAVGDEGLSVEGEAGLEGPEAAEAECCGEAGVGGEETREEGEEEAEEGGDRGERSGDGVALGF